MFPSKQLSLQRYSTVTTKCNCDFFFLKIQNAKDKIDFLDLIWSPDVQDHLSNCRYNTVPTFGKREELLTKLCHYFVVDRVRTAIEMFKEGLATLGILETMQRHPTAFRKIFCHSNNVLTSEDVNQTFKPKLDDPGSNNQMKQETAVMNW